ncbi:carboxymuconolactone decarboxylase family protein [Schlesneria sp. T3-172]|uniref:carboxymuconolactone decarboxylase family protein n=1 Tax=Schlesneria sphaerica TaxID=3373610 RepID=UPI0037CB64B5
MLIKKWWLCLLIPIASTSMALADSDLAPTRPEMKKRIQALKERTSRLPLPPPTEQEIASGRPLVNNGRLRALYLPPAWQSFLVPGWGSSSATRPSGGTAALLKRMEADPSYGFKTRLFWIVSRANDCQYCLGHQELKLKRVGMTDDQVASLDARWDLFPAREQAAMKATRKLTLTPHLFTQQDLAELKQQFPDPEVIDIIYTVSRYNAVNRWTASTGIPQDQSFGGEEHSELDTPTSPEFSNLPSKVIPTELKPRPEWESRDDVEAAIKKAHGRKPGVELPKMENAKKVLARLSPGVTPPVWFQALSDLSVALDAWGQKQAMAREGKTSPELRILIAWVTSRENRAWYAAEHARARYLASCGDEGVLYSFKQLEGAASPANAEALRFARKLTTLPQTIVDEDISRLKEHFNDYEVAEIIQTTCDANAFDRFTEALWLPLED